MSDELSGRTRVLRGPPVPASLRERTGETLVDLLDGAIDRAPDDVLYIMPRGPRVERWTYRQLGDRSRRVAATLARHGIGTGSRVVTWAGNDPWLVAAYFAAWRLGAVIVPLDLRMATDVAERIGRQARPALTLAGEGVSDAEASALGAPVLRVSAASLDPVGDGAAPPAAPSARVDSSTPAEILFTSGTTSDPKGVVLSHGAMVHNGRTIAMTAGLRRERALALIPLSHMYGQIVPLLHGLITGSQVTFLPTLTPGALFKALRRDRITVITAVPQLLHVLMTGIEGEAARSGRLDRLGRARRIALRLPMRLRRVLFRSVLERFGGALETVTCGGAKLTPELQLAWEALGIRVIQGYGATECATIAGHTRSSRRPGTVGPPLAEMEVRISDDGELLARGPNVMQGYWEKPAETAAVLADGWAHTGDAAEIGRHGEVVILGRTRDRIALPNGLKVYPEDVEAAIVAAGPVRTAVVLETSPGRLEAVLVPADAGTTDADMEAAVRQANAGLAPHQRVRHWVRWPAADVPRTHTMKVRRREVAAWLAGGQGVPSDSTGAAGAAARPAAAGAAARPGGTTEDLLPALIDLVANVVQAATGRRPASLTPASSLAELGLDSLGRVGLALQVEETFGAALEDQEIAEAADIAGLAQLIVGRRGAPPPEEPSRWAYSRPARVVRRLLDRLVTGPLVAAVARPRAAGLEHLAALDGPVLICPNHASHLDALSVRHVLPARIRHRTAIAAAADYFFEGSLLGPVVALATGAFPFGRTEHVRASLERVGRSIDDGWNVLLFPEGTRSLTGQPAPFKSGIGLLATQLGVPVVPVGILGTYGILPKGARLPRRRGRVLVRFGEPLRFAPGTPVPEATARIETAVLALLAPLAGAQRVRK